MLVRVHQQHGLLPRHRLRLHHIEKISKTRNPPGDSGRLRERLRLKKERHARRGRRPRLGKRRSHPRRVRRFALAKLRDGARKLRRVVIVAADDMHRRKHDAAARPPRVFHKFLKPSLPPLRHERNRRPPHTSLRGKILGPHLRQPHRRILAPVARAMYVSPLIVARRVNRRSLQGIKPTVHVLKKRFRRRHPAALGVATMHRKRRLLPIELGEQPFIRGEILVPVRHAAHRHKSETLLRGSQLFLAPRRQSQNTNYDPTAK